KAPVSLQAQIAAKSGTFGRSAPGIYLLNVESTGHATSSAWLAGNSGSRGSCARQNGGEQMLLKRLSVIFLALSLLALTAASLRGSSLPPPFASGEGAAMRARAIERGIPYAF